VTDIVLLALLVLLSHRDENARLFRETLEGGSRRDAKRDAVVLNAGMGLYVYGLAPGLKEAFELARSTMESGAAAEQLEKWIAASAAAAAAHAPVAAQ
jgi:anthranilate phosphoribosyltransferase